MLTHLRWGLIAVLLAACHAAPPARPSEPPPVDAGPPDASTSADATPPADSSEPGPHVPITPAKNDPRCPSGLLVAEGVKCSGEVVDCAYKEGTCGCNPPRICSGTAQPPAPGPRPGHWSCTPNDQKLVRLDGCPMVFGAPESSCKQPGKKCVYPSCSWQRQYATCTAGTWVFKVESLSAPPP